MALRRWRWSFTLHALGQRARWRNGEGEKGLRHFRTRRGVLSSHSFQLGWPIQHLQKSQRQTSDFLAVQSSQEPPSRYEFLSPLGTGGSGIVYLGLDRTLNRKVAIKRLRTAEDGATHVVDDIRQEAGVLCRLHHPNIVTVLDFARDDSGPFVVLEYLEGTTLHDFVKNQGPLLEPDFLAVARQCLDALVASQAQKLVHRDLKPGNVMLDRLPSGILHAKLLDFGLATFLHQPSIHVLETKPSLMGTVYFMAPEQFQREPLDARTDLYSLGCVFYFALTALFPFPGEQPSQVIKAHLESTPEKLENLRPDLPVELCRWVECLMKRQPAERPYDAAAALERLELLRPAKHKADNDLDYFYAPNRPLPKVVPLAAVKCPPASAEPPPHWHRWRPNPSHILYGGAIILLLLSLASFLTRGSRHQIEKIKPPQRMAAEWFRRDLGGTFGEGEVWLKWHQPSSTTLALARGTERVLGLRSRPGANGQSVLDLRAYGATVESRPLLPKSQHDVILRVVFRDPPEESRVIIWVDHANAAEPTEAEALTQFQSAEPLVFDSLLEEGTAEDLQSCLLGRDFGSLAPLP